MKPILLLISFCMVNNMFSQETSNKTGNYQIYKSDDTAAFKDSLIGEEFHIYDKEFPFSQRANENNNSMFYIIPRGNFTMKIIKPDSTLQYSGRVIRYKGLAY